MEKLNGVAVFNVRENDRGEKYKNAFFVVPYKGKKLGVSLYISMSENPEACRYTIKELEDLPKQS